MHGKFKGKSVRKVETNGDRQTYMLPIALLSLTNAVGNYR